jgi:Domain of unknown function (DUF5666)
VFMNRILCIAIILAGALTASAADRFARDPEHISIATTGRIIKIDQKNKTLRVRGSDGQTLSFKAVSSNISQMMQGIKQKIGVTLPGGITIALPGRTKNSSKPADNSANNLEEYTVVTNNDTTFEDGSDSIRFEDFKNGESVSIHGVLTGSKVTASRIAKWF